MRRAAAAAVVHVAGLSLVLTVLVSVPVVVIAPVGSAAAGELRAQAQASAQAQAASEPLSTIVLPALGPGYVVATEGPLDPSTFAADAPDPGAAAGALKTLGSHIATYQRTWRDGSQANEVQDLVVRFPNAAAAQVFLRAVDHSLAGGEIVNEGPVPSVPGARRVTYFGSTTKPGVGEAITMRAGLYVAQLSFFSASAGNAQPISPADGRRVARSQLDAMSSAPGGRDRGTGGMTLSSLGWAVLAVAVLAVAVAAPLLVRWHRARDVRPQARPRA